MNDPYLSAAHDQIGGIPEILGPWQLELLRLHDLEPNHRVLDLGCGTLRGGLHIIDFLDPNCYFGADPNQWLLDTGEIFVNDAGLAEKNPRLGDLDWADTLPDHSFDFILTQSVLNHLDRRGIRQLVERAEKKLAPDGMWLGTATFCNDVPELTSHQPHPTRPNEFVSTKMNPDWFASILNEFGLQIDFVLPMTHPRSLDPFRIY